MSHDSRAYGGAALLGHAGAPGHGAGHDPVPPGPHVNGGPRRGSTSPELARALAEVKGQAQFLLYLADQLEDALQQLSHEPDPGHGAFLCKILGMYSSQLESRHQGLGDRIAEACQEIYVTVREFDPA